MKKIFMFILAFSSIGNAIFAQNADYKNVFSVHYGASLFNAVEGEITGNGNPAIADSLKYSSALLSNVPTIGVTWDYGAKKWFSVGVAASYTQAKAEVNDLEVRTKLGTFDKLGDFSIAMPRSTVSARFLLHYGNKKRFDCYTGVRLGASFWSVKKSSNIDADALRKTVNALKDELELPEGLPFVDDISTGIQSGKSFVRPQAQFIIFGLRGYVTPHIGINAELAAGSPYFFSLGANYRF